MAEFSRLVAYCASGQTDRCRSHDADDWGELPPACECGSVLVVYKLVERPSTYDGTVPQRCQRVYPDGTQHNAWAVRGSKYCRSHGGRPS